MKRLLIGLLLAMALVVSVGPAGATGTTTSCGQAYIAPFFAFHASASNRGDFILMVSNVSEDTVHVKITLYYQTGTEDGIWETDLAPNCTYRVSYDGSNHTDVPSHHFGKIEWTAQFCTQKPLIASAVVFQQYVDTVGRAMGGCAVPINNGLPF